MKASSLILFILSFCISSAAAQKKYIPKNNFKYGYATSFLKTGDYFGKLQYLEYNRSLFRPLSIGLVASKTKADQIKSDGFEQTTLAYQGDANLYLLPVNNNVNSLKLGGGAVYRRMDYATTDGVTTNSNGELIDKVWATERTEQFGFSVSLEYEVYIAKHIILGSKAAFQQFEDKDQAYYWGLNFGLRF